MEELHIQTHSRILDENYMNMIQRKISVPNIHFKPFTLEKNKQLVESTFFWQGGRFGGPLQSWEDFKKKLNARFR